MPCMVFHFQEYSLKTFCKIYLFPNSAVSYHTFWYLHAILFSYFKYKEFSVCLLVLLNQLL